MNTEKRVGIATVAFAGLVVTTTLGGMFQAWSDGYFLGRARKKGVTYKNIARRNAAMGSVIGSVVAAMIIAAPDKKEQSASAEGMFGIGNPPNVY